MYFADCSVPFTVSSSGGNSSVVCNGVLSSVESASIGAGGSATYLLPPLSIADAATITSAIVLVWVIGWVVRLIKSAMGSR